MATSPGFTDEVFGDPELQLLDEEGAEMVDEEEVEDVEADSKVPQYLDDDLNLVSLFNETQGGRDELKRIVDTALSEFDIGWESTQEYRESFGKDWLVLAGNIPAKGDALKYCANEHMPSTLENISRLTFRAYGEIFKDWQEVFRVHKLGANDGDADAMTVHGNWQLRNEIPDFKRQMHRALLAFFFVGDVTVHSYYDEERRMNRHETLTPDEFVVPYAHHTTMPDYSDVPWRAKIMMMQRHEIEAYRGSWDNIDAALKFQAGNDDEPIQEAGDMLAEIQGQESKTETDYAPHKVILWEGWMDMPYRDRQMFIQLFVHYASRKPLKLRIHEEPDWREVIRYEQQVQERDLFFQAKQEVMAAQAQADEMQRQVELAGAIADEGEAQGFLRPETAERGRMVAQQQQRMVPQVPPMPPPPSWMQNPEDPEEEPPPVPRVPVHMFSHGVCFESLVGNLGLSYGKMQADHNRAEDIILNQFIDQATFGNLKVHLVKGGLELPEKLVMEPGGVIPVAGGSYSQSLRDSIMPIEMGVANPQMMELVKFISEQAKTSVQATEILSGEPGKSGETARGIAMRLEQAVNQLSVAAGKFVDMLTQVLRNNAKLNSIFLPDEQVIAVTDHIDGPKELRVGAAMYERNYSVEVTADMRFATKAQKIAEADEMVAMVFSQAPIQQYMMQYPQVFQYVLQKAFRVRGEYELARIIGQPPAPPPGAMQGQPPPGMGGPPPPQGPPQ